MYTLLQSVTEIKLNKMDNENIKKVKDLTAQQFLEAIQEAVKGNTIEVGGVVVHSTNENLTAVERTINRLIKKHKDFILMRKQFSISTGGFG